MQKLVIAVLTAACLAAPAAAADRTPRLRSFAQPIQFRPLGGSPGQLPRLAAQARQHARTAQKGVGSNAVVLDRSGQDIVIAAVANAPGAFGTFFTSDLTLANYDSDDQKIAIFYLARGQDNRNAAGFGATLQRGTAPETIPNILGQLGLSGVGSLYIVPIDNSTPPAFDPVSSIDAYSRLLTPGEKGELSQSFPAVYPDYLDGESSGLALGHRQDANFRVNTGAVNMSETAQNFKVTVVNETGFTEFTINVPPFSMNQVAIPAGSFGALSLYFETEGDPFEWIGYAASNDNRSGDSWSSFATRIMGVDGSGKQP